MDLHVRYWANDKKQVKNRYYNSQFLGNAARSDISEKFMDCVAGMDEEKILQVSMDGPNVNNNFHSNLAERREEENMSILLDLATFG